MEVDRQRDEVSSRQIDGCKGRRRYVQTDNVTATLRVSFKSFV